MVTARPERVEQYAATYDPSASIAVWSRSSRPRPDGGWWTWHSVERVAPDGETTWTVCGLAIYGETLDVPTVLGHWPELDAPDDRVCKRCRRLDFDLRLSNFSPGQVASEPVCWPQASDETRAGTGETR